MSSIFASKRLPSRPYSHRARWGTDSWTWEILSTLLSVLAIAAVVILLLTYDGKSFPDLPHNIGINSVVAVLGTVSKSALLLTIASCISQYKWLTFDLAFEKSTLQDLQFHDEASRGPWGAFMLLINWKGLSWAKLGALVTVLSIAFDPAYQALISVEQRSQYRHNPAATVKRALDFQVPQNDHSNYGLNAYFSTEWTNAIVNAILSDTSKLETNPSCPTGNCTFPIFSSLAFCSNCIDITEYLQQTSNCTQRYLGGGSTAVNCTYWFPLSSSGRNYTDTAGGNLPQDTSEMRISWDATVVEDQGATYYGGAPAFLIRFLNDSRRWDSLYFNRSDPDGMEPFRLPNEEIIPSSFATIALIKGSPMTGTASTGYINTANICAFSFCAREYNVSMQSGLLRSEIVSTSYSELKSVNKSLSDGMPSYNYTTSYPYTSSYTFTFPDTPANNFNFIPRSQGRPGSGKTSWTPAEVILWAALVGILGNDYLFNGDPIYNNIKAITSSLIPSGLNASMNIPKTMDRVAAAMTNHLRDTSNRTVIGQSGSMELYIRVSWQWLLFPITSIFLGTTLLASVIIATRRRKLPVWKTSELALLLHGLDSPLDNMIDTRQVSAMEEVTSAVQVRLIQDSTGALKLRRKLE